MKSVETERRWMREERRWLNEASHSKPQRDVLSVKFNTIPRRTVPHTRIKRKLRNLGFDNLEQALQSQIWAFSRQKVTFLTLKRPRSTRAQILCSLMFERSSSNCRLQIADCRLRLAAWKLSIANDIRGFTSGTVPPGSRGFGEMDGEGPRSSISVILRP